MRNHQTPAPLGFADMAVLLPGHEGGQKGHEGSQKGHETPYFRVCSCPGEGLSFAGNCGLIKGLTRALLTRAEGGLIAPLFLGGVRPWS